MKKGLFILFSLISFYSFGQPIIQRAGASNTVKDERVYANLNLFVPKYADTIAANVQKGIDSAGAIIYTYNTKSFWYRQHSPKKWVEFGSGGVPTVSDGLIYVDSIKATGSLQVTVYATSSSPAIWRISGNDYYRYSDSVFTITAATSGYYRKDIIVGNTLGKYQLIQGVQSTTTAVQPATPSNTVLISVLDISGSSVAPPSPDLTQYFLLNGTNTVTGDSTTFNNKVIFKWLTEFYGGTIRLKNQFSPYYTTLTYNASANRIQSYPDKSGVISLRSDTLDLIASKYRNDSLVAAVSTKASQQDIHDSIALITVQRAIDNGNILDKDVILNTDYDFGIGVGLDTNNYLLKISPILKKVIIGDYQVNSGNGTNITIDDYNKIITVGGTNQDTRVTVDDYNKIITVGGTNQGTRVTVDDNNNRITLDGTVRINTTTPIITPTEKDIWWNEDDHTLNIQPDISASTLQVGQESWVRVVNKTGSPIADGTVVYINSAQGNRPTITAARADNFTTAAVIGVVTSTIADNAEGFVTTNGIVNGYNTAGFSAGDELYLSASSAGQLTKTAPSSPNFVVRIGYALNSTNNGKIYVSVGSQISTNTSLGTSNLYAPTQGAVKAYVDAADALKLGIADSTIYSTKANSTRQRDSVQANINKNTDSILAHNTRILDNTNSINTNDNLALHKAGSETISGNKIFTTDITAQSTTPKVKLLNTGSGNNADIYRTETNNELFVKNKVYEVGGAASNGLLLSAQTQYAEANTSISLGSAFSISFWFKSSTTITYATPFYMTDGTNSQKIFIEEGRPYLYYNNTSVNGVSWINVYNTWAHYVIVVNGTTVQFYINGALTATTTLSNKLSSVSKIVVGYQNSSLPYYQQYNSSFNVFTLDQLLIYNSALTASNVTTIYSSGSGTSSIPTSNLISRWEFNEGTGNTVDDAVSTNDFTLYNSPTWMVSGGKIPTDATIQNATVIYVRDGINNGERGQYHFGDPFGGTYLRGRSVSFLNDAETYYPFRLNNSGLLLNATNPSPTATASNTLSVVGSLSVGNNTASPANGANISGRALFGTTTDNLTDQVQISGNINLVTAGNKIKIATGTNASAGTGTFSSGTSTISTTAVTSSSLIFIQYTSCSSCGTTYINTKTANTSFVVTSTNAGDASTFNWIIIN